MTTAITKTEEKRLAQYGDLMDDAPVQASHILIPKLLLMQPTSQFVSDEKAKSGDIVNSLDGAAVVPRGQTLEIIPFKSVTTWVKFKNTGSGKPQFVGQVPYTMANADTPRQEIIENEEYTNFETINYYCLLPSEIKTGEFLPYVVQFRSTSFKTGKKLETYRAKMADFRKPICFKTFELGSRQEENDKGRFFTFTIDQARDTTDAELAEVKPWMARVKTQDVKVDESDLEGSDDRSGASTDGAPVSSREF